MSTKFSYTDLGRIPLAESSGGTYKTTVKHLLKLTGPKSSVSTGMYVSALSDLFSEVTSFAYAGPYSVGVTYFPEILAGTLGAANVTTMKLLLRVYSTGLILSGNDASGHSWLAVLGGVAAK